MTYIASMLAGLSVMMLASAANAESVSDTRRLTLDGAKNVIAAAVAEARRVKSPGGSIAVVDEGGNLLALERLDQTFAASANIAMTRLAQAGNWSMALAASGS